ncbi:hypothetical protein D2E26_0563 [Bifidobacterium dolichotidis]|uniref:Uncharacterized protein n=1 Tax=Bifidobacterium dolichotidis TaxID=2306976 RepID=A0A430FT06_9BIFI|nr:hypothetical protein [Bifidobacterium dolichotidis]RSX56000.1 hypothetical protein D2E26_0563 [Bifidobacterium dolichotidis]
MGSFFAATSGYILPILVSSVLIVNSFCILSHTKRLEKIEQSLRTAPIFNPGEQSVQQRAQEQERQQPQTSAPNHEYSAHQLALQNAAEAYVKCRS